ncbi:MAG: DinB family protein [Gemmatimonadota bacterium]
MKSLHAAAAREEFAARIAKLTPAAVPRWGKMSAPEMVVHLADALRMATGDLAVRSKKVPVRFPPLKQLLIYVIPFPKGLPTAPELRSRAPSAWDGEVDDLVAMLEQFGQRDSAKPWPAHPVFGTMSRTDWGVLAYRHTDHHLRQFNV